MLRQPLLIVCWMTVSIPSPGQQYFATIQTYGSHEGFNAFQYSGNVVKDKNGFLWIGSDNGLYRFDGQNFKAFHHNPNDSTSLPSDNVRTIFLAKNGVFWVNNGTKGIARFDPHSETFSPWINSNCREIDIAKCYVLNFFQDDELRVWVVIAGLGIARINERDNTLKLFSFYKDSTYARKWHSTAWLGNVVQDRNHLFWIASHDGLICFDAKKESYTVYKDSMHPKEYEDMHVSIGHIYIDSNNIIWAGTWGGGLKRFVPQTKKWETFLWNQQQRDNNTKNIVHHICAKSANELWVATADSSLLIYNTVAKHFTPVVNMDANAGKAVQATILFEDNGGNLWCSGLNSLIRINTNNDVFHFQPVRDNSLYGTGFLGCSAFFQFPHDSLLYIGTYYSKGVYVLNKKSGEIKNYPWKKNKAIENINQFLLDSHGVLWIASNIGVFNFDPRKKKYQLPSSQIKNHLLLQSNISRMLEDEDGSLWFASRENGLLHYDKTKREIVPFRPANGLMPLEYIMCFLMDSKGNIWAGYHGQGGLVCIKKNRKDIVLYNYASHKIPGYDVSSICESKEGNIFFNLHVNGLGLLENPLSGKDSFLLFTNRNGLPGSSVLSVLTDKQENLWVSTNYGLSVCRTADMSFRNFTTADGLRNIYSDVELSSDDAGNIYLGYDNGFQYFQPATLNRTERVPPVILHSFKLNGKEYRGDINSIHDLHLKYDEANFTFEYAALTFSNNDQVQYAYQLKGYDKSWRFAGTQRYAAYSIPHGGDYILQIKATYGRGEWSKNPYELVIHVKPPFWEMWWFRLAAAAIFIAAVYWFIKKRISIVRRAEQRKTDINKIKAEAEMKALRAQMNPHFIFNCMNTIDAYMHLKDPGIASAFLHKFSKLIRLVLENSQHAFIPIQKDLEALELYIELEEQRNDHKFSHEICVSESLVKKGYKIPPLLIQPYVENAILHGLRHKTDGKGLLKIIIVENGNVIYCTVEDDGVGRAKSAELNNIRKKENSSLGLKVSKERIESLNELHNGNATVEISDGKGGIGTIVKLSLPNFSETM